MLNFTNYPYSTLIKRKFINAHVIFTFLANLGNAITFAKLYTIHANIPTSKDVTDLFVKLRSHQEEDEILKLDIHSWYSLIKTPCYFRPNRIFFAIEIPIVNPRTYRYLHLYLLIAK